MQRLTRLHTSGSEAVLKRDSEGWRIQLNIRETARTSTTVGLSAPTLDEAKELADRLILKEGHTCDGQCGDWQDSDLQI
jgi:hypothetical protein